MTIHAAAQALGYSDMTIRRRIEARQFPAVKIGSKALVPRAFVEQLIADALAGKTVVVEEYAAAWLENGGSALPDNGPDGRLDEQARPRAGGPMSSVFEHLDQVVERLASLRDELLADEFAPDRAARLAAVFESEARAWSQVYELSSLRLVWRAALAAEAGARANAALWARRAAAERAGVVAGAELGCRSGGCAPPGGPHHERAGGGR